VAAQKTYPNKHILATKIDYKSAYGQGILHLTMVLKMATQLPDDLIAIITLQLTFGGALCPFEWGINLETVRELANKLLKCKDWEPQDLHASVQTNVPPRNIWVTT
jgi:hypothetical protein